MCHEGESLCLYLQVILILTEENYSLALQFLTVMILLARGCTESSVRIVPPWVDARYKSSYHTIPYQMSKIVKIVAQHIIARSGIHTHAHRTVPTGVQSEYSVLDHSAITAQYTHFFISIMMLRGRTLFFQLFDKHHFTLFWFFAQHHDVFLMFS